MKKTYLYHVVFKTYRHTGDATIERESPINTKEAIASVKAEIRKSNGLGDNSPIVIENWKELTA